MATECTHIDHTLNVYAADSAPSLKYVVPHLIPPQPGDMGDDGLENRTEYGEPYPLALEEGPSRSHSSQQTTANLAAGSSSGSSSRRISLRRCMRLLSCLCGVQRDGNGQSVAHPGGCASSPTSAFGRRGLACSMGTIASSTGQAPLATSIADSSDSQLGPLPPRHHPPYSQEAGINVRPLWSSPLSPSDSGTGFPSPAGPPATTATTTGRCNRGSGGSQSLATSASTSSGPTGGPLPCTAASLAGSAGTAVLGGGASMVNPFASRGSSMASFTSGITTTSRPSRWGMLAGILSAGLRSFSQIAGIIEPETGNLTAEAVIDLTRHASRLDLLRACGQVIDLNLVGAGAVGLVYRGRVSHSGAAVCVKYVVTRGANNMAAPATEGLLCRTLAHRNIVTTYSWHVTRISADNFLDLTDALAGGTAPRETQQGAKNRRRGGCKSLRLGPPRSGTATCGTGPQNGDSALAGGACSGRDGGGHAVGPHGSGAFTAHILELVQASAAAGSVSRARPSSSNASPLARMGFGFNRSFSTCVRSGGAGGGMMAAPTPLQFPAAGPLVCVAPNFAHASLPTLMPTHHNSQRSDFARSYSMADVASSLLPPSLGARETAAGCVSGTTAWFSRDSLSSHYMGQSPNPSHHAPVAGGGCGSSGVFITPRGTIGGGGAEYGMYGGSGQTGPHPQPYPLFGASPGDGASVGIGALQLSAPGSVISTANNRNAMLARAGSRLQFATTSLSQRAAIPEDCATYELDGGQDAQDQGGCGPGPGPTSPLLPSSPCTTMGCRQAAEVHLPLKGFVGSGEVRHVPTAMGPSSGPPLHMDVTVVAAATALGPCGRGGVSVGASCCACSDGFAGGGDADALTGFARRDELAHPTRLADPSGEEESRGGSSGRSGGEGQHARQLFTAAPTTITVATSGNVRSGSASKSRASWGGLLANSLEIRPMGSQLYSSSRTGSTVTTHTSSSSRKRNASGGSTTCLPCVAQAFASPTTTPRVTMGGILIGGAGGVTCSAVHSAPFTPMDAPTGPSSAMGGTTIGGGSADVSTSNEPLGQEALERCWRTLQQILQRLAAQPGDYLTRIVMEEADQGSLMEAIHAGRFREGADEDRSPAHLRVLLTALDIAQGMAFLHRNNVIHGDLKPSNVLLCSQPSDPRGFVAKVSDFGLSRIISRGHDHVHNAEPFPAGTVSYMSPETVTGSSCKASDVWSYGVVVWQLVTQEPAPWPGLRNVQIAVGVVQNELRLSAPPSTYPPLRHLIKSCLAHEHSLRPDFGDVVQQLQAMLRDIPRSTVQSPCSTAHSILASPPLSSVPESVLLPSIPVHPAPRPSSSASPTTAAAVPSPCGPSITTLSAAALLTIADSLASDEHSTMPHVGTEADGYGKLIPDVHLAVAALPLPSPTTPTCASAPAPMHKPDGALERVDTQTSMPGLQCSLAATSVSYSATTAAAFSNNLTAVSSSWANTTDRDPRSSAFYSSAWRLSIGVVGGAPYGGLPSATYSRQLLHTQPIPSTGGSAAGTGLLSQEQQCLQELFSRQGALGGVLPGEDAISSSGAVYSSNTSDVRGANNSSSCGGGRRYSGIDSLNSTISGISGLRTASGAIGASVVHAVDLAQLLLPPVHEEALPTSSSSYQTGGHMHGCSAALSGAICSPHRLLPDSSSNCVSPSMYGKGQQRTLPSMLQAGLILLGAGREPSSARSGSKGSGFARSGSGSTPSSQRDDVSHHRGDFSRSSLVSAGGGCGVYGRYSSREGFSGVQASSGPVTTSSGAEEVVRGVAV